MVSSLKSMIWGNQAEDDGEATVTIKPGTVTKENIVKEGWLFKQSRYMKQWKRRYVVLTKENLLTFKD